MVLTAPTLKIEFLGFLETRGRELPVQLVFTASKILFLAKIMARQIWARASWKRKMNFKIILLGLGFSKRTNLLETLQACSRDQFGNKFIDQFLYLGIRRFFIVFRPPNLTKNCCRETPITRFLGTPCPFKTLVHNSYSMN